MTLLKMSIYGAVIILAIILIRAFTLHKLPKKTFLILWSVALLRLLVPFEIASEYSVYSLVPEEIAGQLSDMSESITEPLSDTLFTEQETEVGNTAPGSNVLNNEVLSLEEAIQNLPQSQYREQEISSSNETKADQNTDNPIYLPTEDLTTDAIPLPNVEQNPPADVVDIIIKEQPTPADRLFNSPIHVAWLTGTLLCAVFFLFFYIRAYIEFADATPVTDEYAKDFFKHHWTNRVIYLRQSDKISAPLTYGIFRPVILLPKKMDWENHDQIDYVLYHEFTHIRRFDLIPKLLMAVALCIHWFNPFVWAMYYFFNRDIELSCDECVVNYYEKNHTKADYARALISMEEKKSRITPLCNNFSKNAIEERITAIMKLKKTTIGMIVVGIVIVTTVIITLTTSAKQPEAAVTDGPTATPAPTTVPFKMINFESGEFDEKELAKTLWQRYEEFAAVYNTCINKSMNKDPYTEKDFVEIEIDLDKLIRVERYLPVADSRFPTMQSLKNYVETVCTKEGSDFFLSSTFLNMYHPDDGYEWAPKYVEQNGVLYTKPYDMQAPLLYTAGEPTVYRGEVFFYLLEDNRVAMYAGNNPTGSIYRTYFKQENGIWYVDDLFLDIPGIPDKDGNTLYRFSVPMEELAGAESDNSGAEATLPPENTLTQEEAETIATKTFSTYMTMYEEFFYTSLACADILSADDWVTINGEGGYTKVIDERFPTLASVIEYMETICTAEFAEDLRNKNWHMDSGIPTLAELNGELYTYTYDFPGPRPQYRFININYDQADTITLEYHGYVDTYINVWETGTMTLKRIDGTWKVASHEYAYNHNPYFDAYNGEKLHYLDCTIPGYDSPTICNDIVFYRADEEETLDEVLIAMKTAILERLTIPANNRSFTITSYDVSAQSYETLIETAAWRLPVLEGYYAFEGIDLVTMENRLKKGITDDAGRVPFLAQGSEEVFYFILLREGDVYRLQREESANGMIERGWTFQTNTSSIPLWQEIARSAIGMFYGETDAHDVANREAALLSLKDFGLQDLNIDLSDYSTDREWWENGAFYDEEKNCYYVVYVLSAQAEVSDGPGILFVTVPADQPENYTILPVGGAGELASSALWFDVPVKVGTNIYFNSGHHSAPMWFIDTTTMRLNSLAYINEALTARASAYLSSKGMGTSCDAIYHIEGQMGDHVVFSAEISHAFDIGLPYFTVYFVYHNNRVVGELPLVAEYIQEHTLPLRNGILTAEEEVIRLTLDEFVQAATECFDTYYNSPSGDYENKPYHITSVHMTAPNTAQIEFQITESEEFNVYTDGNATLEYDFAKGAWYVRFYREYPPDYLAALGTFPTIAAEEVIVSELNYNLAAIDEEALPRFSELTRAGGKVIGETSDSINTGMFYTISFNGIEYFFVGDQSSSRDDRAWHLAITSPDYPLSGGAKAGMTTEELLALYPDLAKTELDWDDVIFQALYGPSMFNFRDDQFPASFLKKYDYAYTAYLEKGHDGLPVCIAFLIKDTTVSAITVYMPTAD